jgi:hypothetical protein
MVLPKVITVATTEENAKEKKGMDLETFAYLSDSYRGRMHSPCTGGDKVDYDIRLSYRTVRLHRLAGRGTTTLCHSRLYSPVREYEFGNNCVSPK